MPISEFRKEEYILYRPLEDTLLFIAWVRLSSHSFCTLGIDVVGIKDCLLWFSFGAFCIYLDQ